MAFHKVMLGDFGADLPSDRRGYVPEKGDQWQDFDWPEDTVWTDESWAEYVQRSIALTKKARETEDSAGYDPVRRLIQEAEIIAVTARDRREKT